MLHILSVSSFISIYLPCFVFGHSFGLATISYDWSFGPRFVSTQKMELRQKLLFNWHSNFDQKHTFLWRHSPTCLFHGSVSAFLNLSGLSMCQVRARAHTFHYYLYVCQSHQIFVFYTLRPFLKYMAICFIQPFID